MLRTALLFPGQGSQRPGMLAALPDHPAVHAARDEASAVLGRDWRALDDADALSRTDGAQLALTIAGVAAARALIAEGAPIDVVAGHSVGAFPAAVVAGALSFADALGLVALRGRLMAESHPLGFGMTAIIGLREAAVARLVEQAGGAGPVYLANRNAELQIVVSGAEAALVRVAELALGAGARKAERLNVRTPSHCPLVAPVAERLAEAMRDVRLSAPTIAYVSARRARVLRTAEAIGDDLATNVAEPVRWRDTARLLGELGVELAFETPAGSTLGDLTAETLPQVRTCALDQVSLRSACVLSRAPRG
ncbi:malonate decarboxylase epsilon subunit [Methylopila capsulata]|uniref:Malonyl CoA-acyl carrier protein transacylase n=1 Tax=Methylopila capsulata TaxID=61654 RepID=A0A9W6MTW0_9HYPH|nr:malonate decarboxylase subunit epsilon [Methylopila capsulata]MBM7853144.1 malonate decarboxylase epsilon subunit [Methylopila capsulata]GLK57642.1 malonyl CoA-acyl carrier protein transacylase [Methylopila capsulata]